MAQYQDAQRISFSKAEESRLRQMFNRWAASVEGYNRPTLGNELKIVEVWNAPLYRGVLKTQYDARTLNDTFERIGGRTFANTTYFKESDINRWSLYPYPTVFTSHESTHPVSGTEHIVNCHTCGATGKVTCVKCGGKGTIKRAIQTKHTCPSCKGSRHISYTYTTRDFEQYNDYSDGGKLKGRYVERQKTGTKTCPNCNGSGSITHTTYVDEPCKTCGATGKVTCHTCGGDKRIVSLWKLARKQYTSSVWDYRFPSLIGRSDAAKMVKLIDNSTPWRVVERIRIDKENYQAAGLSTRPFVGGMLSALPSRVARPANTAICFHELEVCECEARIVKYEVDHQQFTCMLVGAEWKLFTVTSPMSKSMDDLKTKVNRYCSARKFGKAWEVLQKVNKYPQAGSNEARMQEQLEERMVITSKLGANLAVMLCVVFLSPLLTVLYGDLQFLAPWSVRLIERFDVGTGGLMFLSLVLILYFGLRGRKSTMPKFSYRVASPLRRFGRGFVVGIGRFMLFAAAAIALTYIGIIPIAFKLFWIALTIVVMGIMLVAWIVQSIVGLFT